jgi:hypothetical protein
MFRPRSSQRAGALRPLRTAASARTGVKSDPTMNRANGTRKGTDVSTRTPPGQNTGDQTVASNVASATWALDRARPAPSSAALPGAPAFVRHLLMTSRYRHRCCRPDRATGPARACSAAVSGHLVGTRRRSATSSPGSTGPARVVMGSLLDRRRPEHASAGRGHAPSGNRTKARSIGPLDGSPMAHPYPVAGVWPGPDAMGFGVVCTRARSGWSPWAAMVPILRKSVGGHRPQFPVTESIRLRCMLRQRSRTKRRRDLTMTSCDAQSRLAPGVAPCPSWAAHSEIMVGAAFCFRGDGNVAGCTFTAAWIQIARISRRKNALSIYAVVPKLGLVAP